MDAPVSVGDGFSFAGGKHGSSLYMFYVFPAYFSDICQKKFS